MYQISVIIPAFNVQEYIGDCLQSLVNQTIGIENIEVIIVNDKSTDESINIILEYAQRYPTIKIIEHGENLGSGAARNSGLRAAQSTLISFLDADDYISLNTFEIAVNKFKESSYDIFIYEYEYYSASNIIYQRNPSASLFSSCKTIKDIKLHPEIIFATSVCNKVFRREIIDNLEFSHSKIEDVVFSSLTTFKSKLIYISNECKYYYRKRENKGSKTDVYFETKESFYDHLDVNIEMHQLIKSYPEYKELIDWFNARSLHPFVYNLVTSSLFSNNAKKRYYERAKQVLNVDEEIVNKLEKPLSRKIIRVIQKSSFIGFYSSAMAMKLKYKLFNRSFLTTKIRKISKIVEIILCIVIAQFFRINKKYRQVWLLCERGDEARDNGYSFYKFLRTTHPEINAYFLIDPINKEDYKKVQALGNTVKYRSMKHKMLFILAENLVTAHRGAIEPWNYGKYLRYFKMISMNKKYIFLQHGITKDDVSNVLGRKNTHFDLFITGARPEYDYISSRFGYERSQVAYTGFARFDDLYHLNIKKQILVMPTWRKKLAWSSENKEELFVNSEYYRRFQSLINNDYLNALLSNNGYSLVFYPHHEMQPFLSRFNTTSKNITVASQDQFDIQQLLRDSAILITDFSSVFFDFGYMGKPVIYYQFDSKDFFNNHYKKGYFDYNMHGFGPVLTEEQEIVNYTEFLIKTNHEIEATYQNRINNFFELKDQKNSERIFETINRLK